MNKIIGKTITIIALILSVVYLSSNIAIGVWLIDLRLEELGAFVLITGITLPIFAFFLFAGFGVIVDTAAKYKGKYLTEQETGTVAGIMNGSVSSEGQKMSSSIRNSAVSVPVKTIPWTCPKCGSEIDGKQDVCMQCGTMKPQAGALGITVDWYCKKCGTLNNMTSGFCFKCGTQKL